jgi:phage shock protein PspC (stress-responsive transcriptional regulator)
MSKIFTFQKTKQKLIADKNSIILLESWNEAISIVYDNQVEIIKDLENSLYSKLQNINTVDKNLIAKEIGNLHNLNQSLILQIQDSISNRFYLNPKRAILSGVCDMIARATGWNVIFIRFFGFLFGFFTGGIAFGIYLVLSLILPNEETSLTNFLTQAILNENLENKEIKNDLKTTKQKINTILNYIWPNIFRTLKTIILYALFIFSTTYAYICTGLILQQFNLWPDVLRISTDIVDTYNSPVWFQVLFFTTTLILVLLSCLALIKLIQEIKSTKPNAKIIYKQFSQFGLLILIFLVSQFVFINNNQDLSTKTFAMDNTKEISIIPNGFGCPTKYKVIIQKSDLNTISLVAETDRITGLTFDKYNEEQKVSVTNIYPFRTCFMNQKSEVSVIINTNQTGLIVNQNPITIFSPDKSNHIYENIVFGFNEGDIKFFGNQPNVIYVK